ncbi:hypothetical protein DP113_14435 [Brasilonema octagenarum UFV-E1]|uniref:Uncharacterized protein n=2 Tax=Brasilonema TaxID=383614 RepID=A0A856MIZ1_9CYAN|nr:hypothetical protein [Brasilonema sennae]QDL08946.1 hypothetical protein DP114_14505 [Brasilonema sennae CENA114]QDL15301.1 hypothetical protein DP113_14435 [Brasilonema octagenarum UFV-E1]
MPAAWALLERSRLGRENAKCYNGAARYVPPLPPKSCLGNPPSGMRKAHALRRKRKRTLRANAQRALCAYARCLGRETLLQQWSHRNALAPLLHSAVSRWAGLLTVAHLSVEPLLDLGLPVFSASGVFPESDYYATSIGFKPLSER